MLAVDPALEGSYLHYRKEGCRLIRGGKVVGDDNSSPVNGLVRRNEEGHRKKAVSSSLLDGECFYTLYPSQSNKNQFPNKRGYFEELSLYCGFSFIRNKNVDGLTSTDNGILDWSMYIRHLDKSNIRAAKTLREKQLTVVGYFIKMCYDIYLCPRHNVSNNPGFENILGMYDNAKRL